ncbi:siderophore-interacting protein, partial [Dietzia sp. Cai40]
GEAETVMKHLRPLLRSGRGVPARRASISGYWRRGRTEEGFRTWKRELAESEPDQQPVR